MPPVETSRQWTYRVLNLNSFGCSSCGGWWRIVSVIEISNNHTLVSMPLGNAGTLALFGSSFQLPAAATTQILHASQLALEKPYGIRDILGYLEQHRNLSAWQTFT